MKIDLPGLHKVNRKLKDGTTRVHYYAWRGGPALTARPGTLGFIKEYDAALAARAQSKAPRSVFQSVISEYIGSKEFTRLSDRARSDYNKHIVNIQKEFDTLPLSAFKRENSKRTRGIFKKWRDALHQRSNRQGDYAWTVLARICSVGKDRGLIEENPCEKGGRAYKSKRQELIWYPDDEEKFYQSAPEHISLAVLLAIWTGQRQGDLLRMRWNQGGADDPYYDGTYMYLRQNKGGAFVRVTVVGPLKTALEKAKEKAAGPYILMTTRNKKWKSGFASLFSKLKTKAGLGNLTFHDLRGTAVTRLALAGATVAEIAAVTGHSMSHVEGILAAHYLGGKVQLADQAMMKLEAYWANAA
jgi:integrase